MESGQGARVNADGKWMGRTSTLKWDGGRQIGKADENCLTSWEFPIFFPLQYLLAWAQDAQNPKWKPGMARESSRRASGSGPRSRKVSPWRSEKTEKITNFFLTFPPPLLLFLLCLSLQALQEDQWRQPPQWWEHGATVPKTLREGTFSEKRNQHEVSGRGTTVRTGTVDTMWSNRLRETPHGLSQPAGNGGLELRAQAWVRIIPWIVF